MVTWVDLIQDVAIPLIATISAETIQPVASIIKASANWKEPPSRATNKKTEIESDWLPQTYVTILH